MGRTNPTYRDALRALKERWDDYRRALRQRDKPRFDQLFDYAREHADAAGFLNHQNPIVPTLLSIDLEQEQRIDDVLARLDAQQDRLDEIERALSRLDDCEAEDVDLPDTDHVTANADPDAVHD